MVKIINPPFELKQVREKLAASSCTQEVADTAANPINFQNETPCADHFVLLNHL